MSYPCVRCVVSHVPSSSAVLSYAINSSSVNRDKCTLPAFHSIVHSKRAQLNEGSTQRGLGLSALQFRLVVLVLHRVRMLLTAPALRHRRLCPSPAATSPRAIPTQNLLKLKLKLQPHARPAGAPPLHSTRACTRTRTPRARGLVVCSHIASCTRAHNSARRGVLPIARVHQIAHSLSLHPPARAAHCTSPGSESSWFGLGLRDCARRRLACVLTYLYRCTQLAVNEFHFPT
ncbi:hypothetical protein B0H11DRAFT_2251277 [Mycena galericulata]|nr:hypothetical protein B0H11DRAFT_2251277 [Mycena galericulata]